jgi:hypothetical protein
MDESPAERRLEPRRVVSIVQLVAIASTRTAEAGRSFLADDRHH